MNARRAHPRVPAREILFVGLLAFALLAVASVLYFGPGVAAGSKLFFAGDIGGCDLWHLYYPYWHQASVSAAAGELPFWASAMGTGFPLLAEGQVGALYPPSLLLRAVLPMPVAFNLSVLLHLALAGAFAAAFARVAGAGRAGSLLAGLVFGLGGFFLVHVRHPNLNAATAWFPLILLLVERYLRCRQPWSLGLLALVVAMSFLAGHPQMAAFNLFIAGNYAAWRLVAIWLHGRREGAGGPGTVRLGAGLLYAVLLGMLLAAPQLVPTYELMQLGPRRGGLSLDEATRSQYGLRHLVLWVAPKALGDPGELTVVPAEDPVTGDRLLHPETGEPVDKLEGYRVEPGRRDLFWEVTTYVGLLPLLLAVLALVLRGVRAPPVLPVSAVSVLSLFLAAGSGGGVYLFLYRFVPGFGLFRFPSRFLVYTAFGVSVLAGIGLRRVLSRLPGRAARAAPAIVALVLTVCFLDLWITLRDQNPTVDADRWLTPPGSARALLEAADGPVRFVTTDPERRVYPTAYLHARGWEGDLSPYDPVRTMLDPNLGLLFGLDNAIVYTPSPIRWATDGLNLIFPEPDPLSRQPVTVNGNIAALYNIEYLIDPYELLVGSLDLVAGFPGDHWLVEGGLVEVDPAYTIRVHENRHALPRAFLVPRSRLVPEETYGQGRLTAAQGAVLDPKFDPKLEVLISMDRVPPSSLREGPPGRIDAPVEIVEYRDQRVTLRVDAPRDCWLFMSDTYYPGWVARVDDFEVPVYRANICGRAIWLNEGPHEVRFEYHPGSFHVGVALGLLGLLLVVTLGLQRRLLGRLAARRGTGGIMAP